jgi:S1-C subfamily serine protease
VKKVILTIFAVIVALQSSSTTQPVLVDHVGVEQPRFRTSSIPLISCQDKHSKSVGSGVVVSTDLLLTVEHVIDKGVCSLNPTHRTATPNRLTVTHSEPSQDFAVVKAERAVGKDAFVVNCSPMNTGETYWLVGHAHGKEELFISSGDATAEYFDAQARDGSRTFHMRAVNAKGYSGMSGGAVLNSKGEVVGVISALALNGTGYILVKELGDTKVCDGSDK